MNVFLEKGGLRHQGGVVSMSYKPKAREADMNKATIKGFTHTDIFAQAHLAELGATFEEFQADPEATLAKYGQRDAVEIMERGFMPLNAKMVKVRQDLEAGWKAEGTWQDSFYNRTKPRVARAGLHQSVVLAA